jgi:Tfp pilus assembly protein PilO
VRDLAAVHRRFIVLAIVLAVIAIAAAAFLFTPYGSSRTRLQEEHARLFAEKNRKQAESGSLANIDDKLVIARQQIDAFYRDRLPEQYSAVSAELAKRAQESGVKLGQVKYDVDKDVPAPGVRSIHIGATVNGNYVNIAKFINALERDKMLFVPASVDLAEGQGGVTLQLKVDTYLREGSAGDAGGGI